MNSKQDTECPIATALIHATALRLNFHEIQNLSWTLRISSGVSKGIDKSVVQSGRDFPYIRVGGGQ